MSVANTNWNTTAARMMNGAPFGDSLMSSYFGTQGHIWGDQSIQSAGSALLTEPASVVPLGNQNQREKLWQSIGQKPRKNRLCGGQPCPVPGEQSTVNLNISKGGDISLQDKSLNVAAPTIPGFNLPDFNFDGSGSGTPINFVDVAGDRYSKDDNATPASFWDNLFGTNDCADVCKDVKNDAEAYRLCMNDCAKTNTKNDMFSGANMRNIVLLIIGVVLLAAGMNALTR